MRISFRRMAVVYLLLLPSLSSPSARSPQAAADRFTVSDAMIPMRDGVRLHVKIFTPKDQTEALPIVMKRTPYGVEGSAGNFNSYLKALADEGYIFVFQDIRGKYGSEGTFVMQRPPRKPGDPKAIDEGTDTYDTIEWLLKNVPRNNGRVGMLGISYDGWTTIMGAIAPHPALKAISPQASPADMWLGDDFHHNGAFRLSYGFEYAAMMESGKDVQQFSFDRYDTFDWYLSLGPLSNVNRKYLHERIPTWNDYVNHPDYDEFWKRQTMIPTIKDVKVPTLNVAGWWDQEDFYGPVRIYEELEKYDTKHLNYLVVGPWNHGGWSRGTGETLGPIPFGSATAEYFRNEVQAPWFAYFLKDKGTLDLPEALTFEAGSNRWRRWDAWPAKAGVERRALYFGENESLGFAKPTAAAGNDAFVSDPAFPVPYRQRPIQATYFPGGSKWSTWLMEDQRFVDDRADVLSWETPPLEADVSIAGDVVAHLFASTTGTDADWIVKLIDVYPEQYPENWSLAGYQLMVSNEVFRGRYRTGFEKPAPIKPNAVLEYTWSLHTQNYTFKKGHRIMVQVQSTWFPLIDRNPQTFVANIFAARPEDFKAATHKIYRTATYPSRVEIPVVTGGGAKSEIDGKQAAVIDLTAVPRVADPPPADSTPGGIVAGKPGQITGGITPGMKPVPLRVVLKGIAPNACVDQEQVVYEVEITNTGATAFSLPSSPSRESVLTGFSSEDYRKLTVALLTETAKLGAVVIEPVSEAFGSEASPGTLRTLRPGGQVLLRAPATCPARSAGSSHQASTIDGMIQVYAAVGIWSKPNVLQSSLPSNKLGLQVLR